MPAERPVRHTWSGSQRFVPRTFVRPAQRFMATEAAGGVVLLLAAVTAIVWATASGSAYERVWATPAAVHVGDLVHLDLDARAWINDGLMTVFFLVVGLEIKRELVHGELRDPRAAALPVIAALGGMAVPALIYVAVNRGGDGAAGWGIPMATDIAFALGVVALVGRSLPMGARVFLLSLAIADDVGAILVIALFYGGTVRPGWVLVAGVAVLAMAQCKRVDVRSLVPYVALAMVAWYALHESGVHPTLAGVVVGLITPAWSFNDPRRFSRSARPLVDSVEATFADHALTPRELERDEAALAELARLAIETRSPLERLEGRLAPWVAFGVVPLFALANAGVAVSPARIAAAADDPVMIGVVLGLVAGKALGVFGATWATARLGIGRLPAGTTWSHVLGLAVTAGVGFTVALFVADLSFEAAHLESAKIGILLGSVIAGGAGFGALRAASRRHAAPRVRRRAATSSATVDALASTRSCSAVTTDASAS
jgi:NhaA family Na+:H+ antiporter